jgi:predicted thioesterase
MGDSLESRPRGPLEVGLENSIDFEVEGSLLTDVGGTLGLEVLSTPALIAMIEQTASMLAYPRLGEGKATVGFEVCVKHVGAAVKGTRCTSRARLDEIIENRKLRFAVEVVAADGRTIGVGTHERRVVDVGGSGS